MTRDLSQVRGPLGKKLRNRKYPRNQGKLDQLTHTLWEGMAPGGGGGSPSPNRGGPPDDRGDDELDKEEDEEEDTDE